MCCYHSPPLTNTTVAFHHIGHHSFRHCKLASNHMCCYHSLPLTNTTVAFHHIGHHSFPHCKIAHHHRHPPPHGRQHFYCNNSRMEHVTILAPRWTREIAGFMPWSVINYTVEDSYVRTPTSATMFHSVPSCSTMFYYVLCVSLVVCVVPSSVVISVQHPRILQQTCQQERCVLFVS
jgi:hypothetical protein